MNSQDQIQKLNTRIEELEYRLAILESFLDQEGVLFGKLDRSKMDALKIVVKNDLRQKGSRTDKFSNRLGEKFYIS